MALLLHKSNCTERLVDALAATVAQPLTSVFEPEWVTVSSPGMERWLSMELAKRLGVWANPAFPFPRKLIELILSALLPDDPSSQAYDPTCMLFGIARLLREHAADPDFARARHYFGTDETGRRRLALAQRLADLFDQYVTYRPELVLQWVAGAGADFQAALFRSLARAHGPHHMAARAQAALQQLSRPTFVLPQRLPARLHLFGVSTLPPFYLDILAALAKRIDVHLFLLSPSREYYGDVRPARTRRGRSSKLQLSFGDAGFRTERHDLLGSLGRHGREFQELLEERTQYAEGSPDLYTDPGCTSLLRTIQSDLLALRSRGTDEADTARIPLDGADDSLSIHACHGAMREVEVLHDQLMRLISERGVEPHQIIVMTPNIAAYAPMIDAVFSQADEQRPVIPFRIADRGTAETEPLIAALEALFDVLQGRFGANQVLDLLGIDLLRTHFEIAPDQVDRVRDWVEKSGIRWGVDAEHRAEVGQPACAENTWRFGLARLALGYSTGAAPEQLFAGHAPLAIDSSDGPLLGSFLEFCQQLFAFRSELRAPATPAQWSERVARLVDACFGRELASAAEHKLLRRALLDLEQHALRAEFSETFDLTALRSLLTRTLVSRLPAHGFLAGGVTFCQLMPMRSIPFQVLCLLGLNDGAFPALESPFELDLMQQEVKPGDRSRRDDDRQLFLEALLCARDTLLITYVGQSSKDGKTLPPSVLVSELIDHVAESFVLPDETPQLSQQERMEQRLVVRHPLSAVSPRYFGADSDARLFSYSRASSKAAAAAYQPRQRPAPFATLQAPVGEPLTTLRLSDLERCLMNPSREFCQQRLALYLGDDLARVVEREPFALNGLERWQIATDLLAVQQRGEPRERGFAVQRAQGRLPLGAAGVLGHEALQADVDQILRTLAQITEGERLPRLEVNLLLDGVRIVGSIDELWSGAHARAQYGRLEGKHELRHFIRHVVLRCAALESPKLHLPEVSKLIGRDKNNSVVHVSFGGLAQPQSLLRELLGVYTAALRAPLRLFPHASRRYAAAILKGKTADEALQAARIGYTLKATEKFGADQADAYVQQLYADFEAMLQPNPDEFENAALSVYRPLLTHRSGQ